MADQKPEKTEFEEHREESVLQKPALDYAADSELAAAKESTRSATLALYLILAVVVFGSVWAYYAEIDEATIAEGKVVPSSSLQVVQNLEGGIVKEIIVKEGDRVKQGQVLIELNKKRFAAQHQERLAKKAVLEAEIIRLSAEAVGAKSIEFEAEFERKHPSIVSQTKAQFETDMQALEESLDILQKSYDLMKRELEIVRPLAKQGVMSDVEKIRLERQLATIEGQLVEKRDKARVDAQDQLNKVKAEYAVLREQLLGTQDRLDRATIRSPVDGIVSQIYVSSIGQVVSPGENIAEVVPLDDQLTIQSYIRPIDIGFIHPGQQVMVKVSAYDATVYGGLQGEVTHISADAITDEKGMSYFETKIKTDRNYVEKGDKKYQIIPGMTVVVHVLTGKKTVMNYIMKPFTKARQEALKER